MGEGGLRGGICLLADGDDSDGGREEDYAVFAEQFHAAHVEGRQNPRPRCHIGCWGQWGSGRAEEGPVGPREGGAHGASKSSGPERCKGGAGRGEEAE